MISFTNIRTPGCEEAFVLRQHWPRPLTPETPRERLLREWTAARTDKEKARILAQWIEMFPDQPVARAR